MARHDVTLRFGRHGTGVAVLALLHLTHPGRQLRDEFVVDRRFDVHALHRHTDLAGVEQSAPGNAVGGAVEVGVGQHDRRVLSAEFQTVGNQPLRAGHRDLAPGGGRPGELQEVGVFDHRLTGLAITGGQAEHWRGTDLSPAAHKLDGRQRRHFRGLEQHGRAGRQGRMARPGRASRTGSSTA